MIPPKGVYWPISNIHYISALANLLVHNKTWLCYYVQVISLRIISNVASKLASNC